MEPTEETDVIDAIDEYLTTKHTTVYGQFYDIQNPRRRRQAAEWLYSELSALMEFIDSK